MKEWSLQQVVLLAFLTFLPDGVFMGAGSLYALSNVALLPLGLSPFANELLFGMWTMVAPIAVMLVPWAGNAVLAGVLAALAEMLYGSYFGPSILTSSVTQGLGSESGFFATRYKRYNTLTLFYSATGMTTFSYMHEYFKFGYGNYGLGMNIALASVRFASIHFSGTFLTKVILRMYQSARGLAVKAKWIVFS